MELHDASRQPGVAMTAVILPVRDADMPDDGPKGGYIAFLPSGVSPEPASLELLYGKAAEFGFPDFVKAGYRLSGDGGDGAGQAVAPSRFKAHYGHLLEPSSDISVLAADRAVWPGAYRLDFLEEIGIEPDRVTTDPRVQVELLFKCDLLAKSGLFLRDVLFTLPADAGTAPGEGLVRRVNEGYDAVRDWLLGESGLAGRQAALEICALRRFEDCRSSLHALEAGQLRSSIADIAEVFDRLDGCGELDRCRFSPDQWRELELMRGSADEYYYEFWHESELFKAERLRRIEVERELEETRRSLGKAKRQLAKTKKRYSQVTSSKGYKITRIAGRIPRALKARLAGAGRSGAGDERKPKGKPAKPPAQSSGRPRQQVAWEDCPGMLAEWYESRTREKLDLADPVTFNQKLQWLKLYDSQPLKPFVLDRCHMRSWVKDRLGFDCCPALLGVADRFEDIDLAALPDRFVVKLNYGCATDTVIQDKASVDPRALGRRYGELIRECYDEKLSMFEMQYDSVNPKVIVEECVCGPGDRPVVYGFLCFGGEPESIWVDAEDEAHELHRDVMSLDWVVQPTLAGYANIAEDVPKPALLGEMLEYARKLSDGFAFVKVDFFTAGERVYLDSMSFYPESGTVEWAPPERDFEYGRLMDIGAVTSKESR